MNVIHTILQKLNIEKDMLYLFNKTDKVQTRKTLEKKVANYQPHVLICANNNGDLQPLHSKRFSTDGTQKTHNPDITFFFITVSAPHTGFIISNEATSGPALPAVLGANGK